MKKKLLTIFIMLTLVITSMSFVPAFADTTDIIYYTTEHGVNLTKVQYDNLTKIFTPEELDCLPIPTIDEMKNDTELKLVDSSEVYIVTKTRYNENNEPIETINEEVTEAEAERIAATPKPLDQTDSASWETSSKKLTLKVNLNHGDVRTATLICKWLVMPKVRSFDVLAIRTSAPFVINTARLNFSTAQNYDGKSVNYSFSGDNTKTNGIISGTGIGTSMNLVNTASNSLSCSMSVKLQTKAGADDREKYFTVYGTYQHATSSVTLSQSQNYSFSAAGLGRVLDFPSSIASKYDGMQGISATVDYSIS